MFAREFPIEDLEGTNGIFWVPRWRIQKSKTRNPDWSVSNDWIPERSKQCLWCWQGSRLVWRQFLFWLPLWLYSSSRWKHQRSIPVTDHGTTNGICLPLPRGIAAFVALKETDVPKPVDQKEDLVVVVSWQEPSSGHVHVCATKKDLDHELCYIFMFVWSLWIKYQL